MPALQSLKILLKNRFSGLVRFGRNQQRRLRRSFIVICGPLPSLRIGNTHVRFLRKPAPISPDLGGVDVMEIAKAGDNIRNNPPVILEPVDPAVRMRGATRTEDLFLMRGPDIRLDLGPFNRTGGQSIAIATSDGTLIENVSFDIFGSRNHRSLTRLITRDVENLRGKWVIVIEPQGPTYGHWLVEFLPRLAWVCEQLGDEFHSVNWLVSGSGLDYEIWALRQLGIPPEKVRWSSSPLAATVENAIIPSFISKGAMNVLPEMIDSLRRRFCDASRKAANRIYVSRKGESFRRVTNEAEVIEALTRLGFTIINPREHSLEEKIRIFSEARLIAGPLSSGMSHSVFMPPGGAVVEIAPASFYYAAEYEIADAAGHHFHIMQEEKKGRGDSGNRFADLTINIEALVRLIAMAEKSLENHPATSHN